MTMFKICVLAAAAGQVTNAVKIQGDTSGAFESTKDAPLIQGNPYEKSGATSADDKPLWKQPKCIIPVLAIGTAAVIGTVVGVVLSNSNGDSGPCKSTGRTCKLNDSGQMFIGEEFECMNCEVIEGDLKVDPAYWGHFDLHEQLPNLRTITGNLVVTGTDSMWSFKSGETSNAGDAFVRVEGDVIIRDNDSLGSFAFWNLEAIGGNLQVWNNEGLGRLFPTADVPLGFNALQTIGGDVSILANFNLAEVDLQQVQDVGGDLIVGSNSDLGTLRIDGLRDVGGNFGFTGNHGATELKKGNPTSLNVGGNFIIGENDNLRSVDFEHLEKIDGNLEITGHRNLEELNWAAQSSGGLESVGGSVKYADNKKLWLVWDSKLTSVGGDIDIYGNGAEQDPERTFSPNFGRLANLGGHLHVHDNLSPDMTLSMTYLGGRYDLAPKDIRIENNNALSVNFQRLRDVDGNFIVNGVTNSYLEFPSLRTVNGDFSCSNSEFTEQLIARNLASANGDVLMENNPLMIRVDVDRLQSVAGDLRLVDSYKVPNDRGNGGDAFFKSLQDVEGEIVVSGNDHLFDAIYFFGLGESLEDYDGTLIMTENHPDCLVRFDGSFQSCEVAHNVPELE